MTAPPLIRLEDAARRDRGRNADALPRVELIAPTLGEFLALDIPARNFLLSPWLPEKGLAMVHGWRGRGKTWLALGIAFAVAAGGQFLRWNAPTPRRVLYVDGEMAAATLQERLAAMVKGADRLPEGDAFRPLAADMQADGLPDLGTSEGQAAIEDWVQKADLIVLDNLSTLCRSAAENDADAWQPMQDWLIRLKRCGKSVLMVHHTGKGGAQRGTSRREDPLDTVIGLHAADDYTADQGARFEVLFEKARVTHGPDARPFEAQLAVLDGAAVWTMRDAEVSRDDRIRALRADGLKQRDIAREIGCAPSTVNRALKTGKPHG